MSCCKKSKCYSNNNCMPYQCFPTMVTNDTIQINDLIMRVTGLEATNKSLQQKVAALEATNKSLQHKVETLEHQVNVIIPSLPPSEILPQGGSTYQEALQNFEEIKFTY